MSMPIEDIVQLLLRIERQPLQRSELVRQFQASVWEGLDVALPEQVRDVLRDLAYDLDFFEASNDARKEDPTYFGHVRLENEVRTALAKLRSAGVSADGGNNSAASPARGPRDGEP